MVGYFFTLYFSWKKKVLSVLIVILQHNDENNQKQMQTIHL